jgi:hypothetical protein
MGHGLARIAGKNMTELRRREPKLAKLAELASLVGTSA